MTRLIMLIALCLPAWGGLIRHGGTSVINGTNTVTLDCSGANTVYAVVRWNTGQAYTFSSTTVPAANWSQHAYISIPSGDRVQGLVGRGTFSATETFTLTGFYADVYLGCITAGTGAENVSAGATYNYGNYAPQGGAVTGFSGGSAFAFVTNDYGIPSAIGSGFTILGNVGTGLLALAFKDTGGVAENPSWTVTNSQGAAQNVAFPAGAAASTARWRVLP